MSGIHKFISKGRGHSGKQSHSKGESIRIPLFQGLFASQVKPSDGHDHQKKVKNVEKRIKKSGITTLKEEHFSYALHSTQGDVDKAISLLLLLQDSVDGTIRKYTSDTKLLGAVNRQGVTCYLDALLFAMFACIDSFEAILYKPFNDEPRQKLAILLRFWVNMLRAGKLITTDITKHIQDALAECGWEDAANLRQQDASEAFTFITEKLELPLLTLKMDIYHTGKEDASDDHRFINERLLEVAIPPDPPNGQSLALEDCLEAYFNNRIEVKRYLEKQKSLHSALSDDSLSISKGFIAHLEHVDTKSSLSPSQSDSPLTEKASPFSESNDASIAQRLGHHDSIVRERFISESEDKSVNTDSPSSDRQQRKGSYRKEAMMPAWQFFSLIPWYNNSTPTDDAQLAPHFSSKRPILGMCLKRYSFTPNGTATRLNTYIDIPTEIGLPQFIQDDSQDAEAPMHVNFKLSLQAIVCHRGNSVSSGHYISIVRGTSPSIAPKHWLRFDDLASERVTPIDIDTALKTESPYLLFYQILSIEEDDVS